MKILSKIYFCLKCFLVCVATVLPFMATAQTYPKNYFASPLEFPISLSGSYGEIRPNHFHAGIDLRTQQSINKNVLSAADGYVWRIVINMRGYGKAIYIKHPAGYVTLYAHNTAYAPEIEKWVRMHQYENHEAEFDLYPDSTLFPVKKGQLIAYSGNTGSSGGPHVHFEVRDAKGEVAMNPLLFGFVSYDEQKPYFSSVTLYPLSNTTYINKKITDQSFTADLRDGQYTAVYEHRKKIRRRKYKVTPDTIKVWGTFGLGVEVFDRIQGIRTNMNKLEVYVDGKQTFGYKLDEFKFSETRNINAMIDYEDRLTQGEKTQKLYLQPNEKLSFIRKDLGSGEITFTDDTLHTIRVVATDVFGNESTLQFLVKSERSYAVLKPHPDKEYDRIVMYDRDEVFRTDEVEVKFPKDVLYDTLFFHYDRYPRKGSMESAIHRIHSPLVALADNIEIKIRTGFVPPYLQSKLVIASVNSKGGVGSSIGGTYKDGWVTAKSVYFGTYAVVPDTKAPTIAFRDQSSGPEFIIKKTKRGKVKKIRVKKKGRKKKQKGPVAPVVLSEYNFTISDNLSGIGRWDAYVDGTWVLCEHDPKSATLTYHFDDNITPQSGCFRLEVVDKVGNKAVYERDIEPVIPKVKGPGQYQ